MNNLIAFVRKMTDLKIKFNKNFILLRVALVKKMFEKSYEAQSSLINQNNLTKINQINWRKTTKLEMGWFYSSKWPSIAELSTIWVAALKTLRKVSLSVAVTKCGYTAGRFSTFKASKNFSFRYSFIFAVQSL